MRRTPKPMLLDLVFAALSDATRRGLLTRLIDGEATVGELAEPLQMSLPAVSKHLRVLEDAGLLRRRINGRTHYITANPKPLHEAVNWIERHRQMWEGSFDKPASLVERAPPETPAGETGTPEMA
ncbi:ArsR/SmtB family transcription factor [Prosthecobacter vanneervenii]|uniref:DNA-binding transcriptional ArsR family regulator n=1 Tax=Prosthecobacter vanneervenii TaxID=48466 RepID=A0A7W8DN02_9BACT|nr:metalloregulator ArsR/SmtB family transcription factor [Prosthecobacter vanneervenii]MBB5035585.1 DNA-binding transcriptional ArsR family regulator [Prosthecobacter vanneervenii]